MIKPNRGWQMRRWPLYAAIAYVLVLVIALTVIPEAPKVTDSGVKIVQYYRDHGESVRFLTWLSTLALIPLALLLAQLRSRLVGLGREVMLLGLIGVFSTTVVWTWFGAGLALHPATLEPETARTITDIGAYFGPTLTVSIVLVVAPVGLAAWNGISGMPRWLAYLSAVLVAEQLIEATMTIFGKRGFIAPGGPMNFMLGAGLYLIWIVAVGVALSPPTPDGEPSAAPRPSAGQPLPASG
jgi:hypothetical protein